MNFMQRIERVFFWLSAASSDNLDACPAWERRKYAAFGATVLVPSTFAIIACAYAMSTLTDNWDIIAPVSLVWSFIILTVDRALLATYRSVFPRVESFLVGNRNDPAEFQNIMLAAFKSPRAPQLTSPKADLQAMLDARYDAPATRPGDPPVLTDDFAPVDHYLLSL